MMIMQVVALGSRALTQNSTGAENEVKPLG